ncbi:MAG: hypothetical protein RIR48_2379, partial [Bacteroidota bacterium]
KLNNTKVTQISYCNHTFSSLNEQVKNLLKGFTKCDKKLQTYIILQSDVNHCIIF